MKRVPAASNLCGLAEPWSVAKYFKQAFADARGVGRRNGPSHLFRYGQRKPLRPLCGQEVKHWNFSGKTQTDLCPQCLKTARQVLLR